MLGEQNELKNRNLHIAIQMTDVQSANDTVNVTDNVVNKREKTIVGLIKMNNKISMQQIAQKCGVTKMTIIRDIAKLKEKGIIMRMGKEKTGHWQIKEQ
ncbi:hypothetical protein AGMMS50239_22610 [Bacteroidia bacterium]|nr:hypothetical protein AGMMS50239_22610 [Bacteroidia bacterium]